MCVTAMDPASRSYNISGVFGTTRSIFVGIAAAMSNIVTLGEF